MVEFIHSLVFSP